jgi:hypothetical protein
MLSLALVGALFKGRIARVYGFGPLENNNNNNNMIVY